MGSFIRQGRGLRMFEFIVGFAAVIYISKWLGETKS